MLLVMVISLLCVMSLLFWFTSLKYHSRQQDHWSNIHTQTQLIHQNHHDLSQRLEERLRYMEELSQRIGNHLKDSVMEKLNEANIKHHQLFNEQRQRFEERQIESLKILQDTQQKGIQDTRFHLKESLTDYSNELGKRLESLTQVTDTRLKEINGQVEKRLAEGFEKTTETFTDVIKRLAMIDAAQKKITELSANVVSLQEILNDKRSRGTFGEVQLSALIRNVLPEQHFAFQHTLSNGKRCDCILFLPQPSGNMVIDAKFPLENYRLLNDPSYTEQQRLAAEAQFKKDIRKHISDIAQKYILPGETADGAVMFIPAEAVFAEIHARHQDLVETAHREKVWLVSPTTMMAILTTARAVLKDAATRKQLHVIQKHLQMLSNDFERFQKRMDKLATHISQAHTDIEDVHTSAKKITQRFGQIEKVELEQLED